MTQRSRTGEVNVGHAGTAVAPFSGNGGLHAANGAVVIGIFLFDAPLDKGRDDNFVVVQGRHAEAQLHDLDALVEGFRNPGLRDSEPSGSAGSDGSAATDWSTRKLKGLTASFLSTGLAADGDILVHGRTCGA